MLVHPAVDVFNTHYIHTDRKGLKLANTSVTTVIESNNPKPLNVKYASDGVHNRNVVVVRKVIIMNPLRFSFLMVDLLFVVTGFVRLYNKIGYDIKIKIIGKCIDTKSINIVNIFCASTFVW